MIFLLASIICSSLLTLLFKLFDKLNIKTFQSIVINYITAAAIGFTISGDNVNLGELVRQDWFGISVLMGVFFIGLFNAVAFTAQKISITVATIANKMSLIIPVMVAVFLYNEALTFTKIIGILTAIVAIYASFYKKNVQGERIPLSKNSLLIPFIVFFGSGILDAMINYAQLNLLEAKDENVFLSVAFGTAGLIGSLILLYRIVSKKEKFESKSIVSGALLGAINYGSMYACILALESNILSSAVFFPVNNIGIVAFSVVAAFLLFKEKLSFLNWMGVLLCMLSIALIAFF